MHWLKTFNRVAAGSLAILLTSCASIKAPKTLFITFGVEEENFKDESAQIRIDLNEYSERFKRSNPDTNIVYINYKSKNIYEQIERDNALNLGPDLVITDQYGAKTLIARDLTTTLPNRQYFDDIYSPFVQAEAKSKDEYTFAPWLVSAQVACFNNTTIKKAPSTIEELKKISASGKKIGLASNAFELFWTAGAQGAVSEISSLGKQMPTDPKYPGIHKWLQWLQQAALYRNIIFHDNQRDLGEKLKNKELDWVTCDSYQIEGLKKSMGKSLGVSALPNGSTSKAIPTKVIFGFALGKNSSKTQRKMRMKFIRTTVNAIALRKIQLDDEGFLAANQDVSIPPEISQIQSAIYRSYNEQRQSYSKEEPGIYRYWERHPQLGRALGDLIDGSLDVDEALKILTTPQTN